MTLAFTPPARAQAVVAPATATVEGLGTQLLRAAFDGDVKRIEALLAGGADPDSVDDRGYTPLIWAAQQGQEAAVASLLAHHAHVDLVDRSGYTALIWAAQQNHGAIAARLLGAHAGLKLREKHGFTALDWATRMGYVDIVRLLLAHGADPDAKLAGGLSARELATRQGRVAITALFTAPTPTSTPPPAQGLTTKWELLGHSATGTPIALARIGHGARTVLLIGTIHGDEPQGADVIARLLHEIELHPSMIDGVTLLAVPVSNPDGKSRHTRGNARGVDLNRNFPTNWKPSALGRTYGGPFPLSEPESRLLLSLIERERPRIIVSFHAAMMCNNFDGPVAAPLARAMARLNGYRLLPDIGYPTPGSLGQQAGNSLGIPIITLEVGHEAAEPLYAKVRDSLVLTLTPDHHD